MSGFDSFVKKLTAINKEKHQNNQNQIIVKSKIYQNRLHQSQYKKRGQQELPNQYQRKQYIPQQNINQQWTDNKYEKQKSFYLKGNPQQKLQSFINLGFRMQQKNKNYISKNSLSYNQFNQKQQNYKHHHYIHKNSEKIEIRDSEKANIGLMSKSRLAQNSTLKSDSAYQNSILNEQSSLFHSTNYFSLQKILQNTQKIKQNQQQLGIELKRLKKHFFNHEKIRKQTEKLKQKPKQINILKSLDFPIIIIQYTISAKGKNNKKDEKQYMLVTQLTKSLRNQNKKIIELRQILQKIYDMYYYPVDDCYEEALLEFIKIKAAKEKLNLKLTKKRIDSQNDQIQIQRMFYYCIGTNESIEIVLFDCLMNQVFIGEKQIQTLSNQVSKEINEIYSKFIKTAKNNQKFDQAINFGEQQIQSEQENEEQFYRRQRHKHENSSDEFTKLQDRLKQILSKDLTDFKDQLQIKNYLHLDLIQNQPEKDKEILRLGQQIDKLNTDLENFQTVKRQVRKKFKQNRTTTIQQKINLMKMGLKRMILAQKQLVSDLPILGKKKQIFQLLDKKNLLILEGQTGSGKSTQLPQLLCEYYKLFENPDAKPVLITQPRKIATRSLAQRVAYELQEERGDFVDYISSSAKRSSSKAKIIFKLDRVVLDEIVQSPTLDRYSCLVIDEAHQRTISIDVILGLVKQLLEKRKDFKVIITSASMQTSLFQKYFRTQTLKVSGRMFPVNILNFPSKEQNMVKKIQDFIEKELLTDRKMLKDKYKGHILVFCSDTSQIQALSQIFMKKLNHNVFLVIPLHGKLTPQDQKKAFSKTKQHKLIFASRIAETAVTIDGIKVVIDPGWDRQMQYDQKTKFSSMKLVTISQSSAKQRAGRAGRTQQGYCFRLYSSQQFYARRLNKSPEIKNMALDTLILRLKTLRIQNIFQFKYIEKPDEYGMKTSTQVLKMIGCLDKEQQITTIGRFLVKIPIEPFLARSIIQGLLMQKVLQEQEKFKFDIKNYSLTQSIIEILCMIINAGNLFRITQDFNQEGQHTKYQSFSHQKGDFFFLKKIYYQFKQTVSKNSQSLNSWLRKNFLIKKTLFQVKDLTRQIKSILNQFSIDEKQMRQNLIKCKNRLQKCKTQQDKILSCLATSFAANLCLYSGNPNVGYTYLNLQKTVSVYGTSCLSLLGACPKWILAYDFYQNKQGKLYCKVANQIDFSFLSAVIEKEDYLFEKYKLEQIEKLNPYYRQFQYQLPTYVLIQLKQLYRLRQYKNQVELDFLKKFQLIFNQSANVLNGYYKAQQKLKSQISSPLQQQLLALIEKIKSKTKLNYQHNYIGSTFSSIGNGFQILSIQIKNTQTVFQISNLDQENFNIILKNWSSECYLEQFGKHKLKLYLSDQHQIQYLHAHIQNLKNQNVTIKNQISDKRKKIPQTKILFHWYAGKCLKNIVSLSFFPQNHIPKYPQEVTKQTQRYLIYLQDSFYKLKNLKKQRQDKLMRGINIQPLEGKVLFLLENVSFFGFPKLTIKKTGINVNCSLDQIQIRKFFTNLIQTNQNINLPMPKMIRKYRQPQLPYCTYPNSYWIQKIQHLIKKQTQKTQNCIKVWGSGISIDQNGKISAYEKSFRIYLNGEVKTFDINLLQKLKGKYQGKSKVLGCQKVHITSVFTQSIAAVNLRVFQSLKQQFDFNVELFKGQYQNLMCDFYTKEVRQNNKLSKVYISCSSPNRQDLLKPMKQLNDLFTPKYISLQDSEFRYLFNKQGQNLLYDIQEVFEYKIYFGFDKIKKKLKLYCHDSITKQIQKYLKNQLSKINSYTETISYKGKNLKSIQRIFQEQKSQIQKLNQIKLNQKYLFYEIIFTKRQIYIESDIETFNRMKIKILQLNDKTYEKQCQICCNSMVTPYKFLNCNHQFCWACIASFVRDFKNNSSNELKCSYFDEKKDKFCNQLINIFDISKILSDQQLQQILDVKISKFVDANSQKYLHCYSPNCQQIFQKETLKKLDEIDCDICGKSYCIQCKQSHKDFSCFQWKQRFNNLNPKQLQLLGVKKCPKCKNGVQKNGGCLHMECFICKTHFCWTCGKSFQIQKQCYNHLVKDHNGIFDRNEVRNGLV